MRGRPRKHAAQHMLDGTYRPREHDNGADTREAVGDCKPTRKLTAAAQKFFDSVLRAYPSGTLGEADSEPLTTAADWVERIHAIRREEVKTKTVLLKEAAEASKQFLQYAVRFGLTPADRGKVKLTSPAEGEAKERKFFGVTG